MINSEPGMKYAKAILLTISAGVAFDLLIGVLIPERVMNVVFVVTIFILLAGILLVAFGTLMKNRWGLNLQPVNCPACGSPMPKVRQPESLKQALWRNLHAVRLRNGQMGSPFWILATVHWWDPLATSSIWA